MHSLDDLDATLVFVLSTQYSLNTYLFYRMKIKISSLWEHDDILSLCVSPYILPLYYFLYKKHNARFTIFKSIHCKNEVFLLKVYVNIWIFFFYTTIAFRHASCLIRETIENVLIHLHTVVTRRLSLQCYDVVQKTLNVNKTLLYL